MGCSGESTVSLLGTLSSALWLDSTVVRTNGISMGTAWNGWPGVGA